MTLQTLRRFPLLPVLLGAGVALGIVGCASVPRVDSVAVAAPEPATKATVARARAVREMRIQASAAEVAPYPDAFAVAGPGLANPPSMSAVAATEDHLTRLGRRHQPASSPAALAAGRARALQLRRLGQLRVQEAEQAIRDASKKP